MFTKPRYMEKNMFVIIGSHVFVLDQFVFDQFVLDLFMHASCRALC